MQAQSLHESEITVSLGAGSSALKYQLEQENSKSGFGGALGVDYSRYFNRMIGVSIGLEAAMFSGSVDMKTISLEQQIQTPPGLQGRFLLRANYEGFTEKQSAVLLQIPVMLRFRYPVNEKNSVFLGTGIKAGFPASSKWNQNMDKLTTTGYSEYTAQTYSGMPNHGFSTYSGLSASGKLELKSPIFFALEGGMKFAIDEGKSLYAGVFLDYGLNSIHKTPANSSMLEYNNTSPADYIHNSVLSTNQFSVPNGIKPFAVGIKIKIGIGSGKTFEPASPKEKKQKLEPAKRESQPKPVKPEPVWGDG